MQKQTKLQEQFVQKGVEFFKENKSGYYHLAMRFGKCRTTIELMKCIIPPKGTVLIAYPDNKLKATWMNECELWEYTNPNVKYVNFSSLKKYTDYKFNMFVIDEFHACSENERELAHEIMENSEFTLGLSGTVTSDTAMVWEMKEIGQYSTLDGIEDGILADYQITVHFVELDNEIKKKNSKGKLKTEKQLYAGYTWVIEQMKRDRDNFMFLALARNRLSLSSLGKMKYLRKLLGRMHDKRVIIFTGLTSVADEIGVPSYHNKSKSDENFQDFQEGKINHLALAAMGKTGVSYTHLDSVILLNFTYNAEETSQILNRAIKLDYDGKVADLHIICLAEAPEKKKLKESLSLLDETKIKYVE